MQSHLPIEKGSALNRYGMMGVLISGAGIRELNVNSKYVRQSCYWKNVLKVINKRAIAFHLEPMP
jgi:hypothetical protein